MVINTYKTLVRCIPLHCTRIFIHYTLHIYALSLICPKNALTYNSNQFIKITVVFFYYYLHSFIVFSTRRLSLRTRYYIFGDFMSYHHRHIEQRGLIFFYYCNTFLINGDAGECSLRVRLPVKTVLCLTKHNNNLYIYYIFIIIYKNIFIHISKIKMMSCF